MIVKGKHRSSGVIGVIDLGTTSVRFTVFDRKGNIVCKRQKEISQKYPKPGWVEEEPQEVFSFLKEMIRDTFKDNPSLKHSLAGLGICNQRESVMLWDRNSGKPLSRIIVWQDRRTAARCRELEEAGLSGMVRKKTGLTIDPYFSATKLEWLLANPAAKQHGAGKNIICGTLDSWVLQLLTGNHLTDVSNASRTMLFDINRMCWDRKLMEIFNIPEMILPRVMPSFGSGVFGSTGTGPIFKESVPVCCVMGDQQASLFGHRCFKKAQLKCTFGTGSFLVANTGSERVDSVNGLISTIFYQEDGGKAFYALEGSIYNTGSILKWLREDLKFFKRYEDIDRMAENMGYQSRLYLVPAVTGLGAPYWDPYAGALIIGFERSTSPAGIVRAALEGAAFRTFDVISAMERDCGSIFREIRIDGGVSKSRLFCQILADITGKKVIKSGLEETSSLGVFLGAGLVLGVWDSKEGIDVVDKAEAFSPKIRIGTREDIYKNWKRAVDRSRKWHIPD